MVRPASKIIFLGFGSSIWIEDNVGAGLGSPRPVPWICHPGLNRPLRKNTIIFSNYRFGRASSSLRKQPTFGDATTGFPAKWLLRNERRNSILMTRHYPDLGSASDWSYRVGNLIQPIRSTTQLWVVTIHQYGISALFSQTSFGGKNSGSVAKCRLFSQAKLQVNLTSTLPFVLCTNCTCNGRFARFFSISSLRLKKSLVCQKQIPRTSIQVRTFARFYLRDHGCWYLHCGVRNRPRCGNFFFTYYNYYLYNTCCF